MDKLDATIVIPTKNGGSAFRDVLDMIFKQKTEYRYEVICVDSGSTDETIDIIKDFPCRLFQIKSEEFGHGKTRNYGASKGTGEFIVFITQDALPASEEWLQNFIDAMKLDKEIAGGFGIHYPYPDCNLPDKLMLQRHFQNFGTENTIFQVEDQKKFQEDEGYRSYMSFFSDNNSCLRRSVWEKHPYKDVDFSEDQIWAKEILALGYKKVYCPHAAVYHSHNYPLKSYLGRCFDEYRALYRLYGWKLAENWGQVLLGAIKGTLSDWRFIIHGGVSVPEKLGWMHYSLWRNVFKYIGAYQGAKFDSLPEKKQEKMNKKLSQQYKQRKA